MDDLPAEVLEQVFAHVPMLELLSIQSMVCSRWHAIISRALFLPWKKSYFRFKLRAHEDQPKTPSPKDSPPPLKKNRSQNDLDMKYINFKDSIGNFSNESINPKYHLHPPTEDAAFKLYETFRLETAGPCLITFMATEFAREEKEGQFGLISR